MPKITHSFQVLFLITIVLTNSMLVSAQSREELRQYLRTNQNYNDRLNTYTNLYRAYLSDDLDSATIWIDKAMMHVGERKWPEFYRKALLSTAQWHEYTANYKKGARYAQYISEHYKQHGDIVDQYKALKIQAVALGMHGDIKASLAFFKRIKIFLDKSIIADKIEHNNCYGTYYSGIGLTYLNADRAKIALKYLIQADSVFQTGGKDSYVLETKSFIGSTYGRLGEYEHSNENLMEVVKLYDEGNKSILIQTTYDNISTNYIALKKFKNARVYVLKSIEEGHLTNDLTQTGFNYLKLGEILQGEKKYNDATEALLKAIEIFERVNNESTLNDVRFKYLVCTVEAKLNRQESLGIANELIVYYHQNDKIDKLSKAYKLRAVIFRQRGLFNDSFRDIERYDSLNQVHIHGLFDRELAELETKYETTLHKRESQKQKKIAFESKEESNYKSKLLWITGAAALFLITLLGVLFAVFKKLKRSKHLLNDQKISIEKSEKEKSILLKELHHRVKNNLQIVSSLLNLQKENVKDEVAKKAFSEGQNRVEAMAMIHRYLYSTDELTNIELGEYFKRLVQSVAYSYGYSDSEISIEFDITKTNVDVDTAIPLGLVANELVSNVFKHAIKDIEHPTLYIGLKSDDFLVFQIKDNGAGIPNGLEDKNSSSFGLSLIKSLAKQMKATLEYTFDNGSNIRLIIPKSNLLDKKETI